MYRCTHICTEDVHQIIFWVIAPDPIAIGILLRMVYSSNLGQLELTFSDAPEAVNHALGSRTCALHRGRVDFESFATDLCGQALGKFSQVLELVIAVST